MPRRAPGGTARGRRGAGGSALRSPPRPPRRGPEPRPDGPWEAAQGRNGTTEALRSEGDLLARRLPPAAGRALLVGRQPPTLVRPELGAELCGHVPCQEHAVAPVLGDGVAG